MTISPHRFVVFACMAFVIILNGRHAFAENHGWALASVPEANMRTEPHHSAELASQVPMGTPLKVLEKAEEWARIESPEGYQGWVNNSALAFVGEIEMQRWRKAPRLFVKSLTPVKVTNSPGSNNPRDVIVPLWSGCIVEGELTGDSVAVMLPDGKKGWLSCKDVIDIESWSSQAYDPTKVIETAFSLMGTPYLWGGTTPKAVDCSGLVKVAFLANGRIMPRDASQQALLGNKILSKNFEKLTTGDLLFFGNPETGRITHVAIYDRDGNYVHSSGNVRYNSFNSGSTNYLGRKVLFGIDTDSIIEASGIMVVKDHPWYFDKR